MSDQDPAVDPFQVLGVSIEASDAEINKAYRKLALKLHPDKQQNASDSQREKLAKEFHDVQQARSFLLDPEFESQRNKYKAKLASQRLRRAADEARNKTMSINRKRMREELRQQEANARRDAVERQQRAKKEEDADIINGLRQEGSSMREEFAHKMTAKQEEHARSAKRSVEERQVRLKWSRRKVGVSPSEDSLAQLMSRFGLVEKVAMLGSKGNLALITFANARSVGPCVDFYKDSDEMRATYISKQSTMDYVNGHSATAADHVFAEGSTTHVRDTESVADWKLRREEERAKVLRAMDAEKQDQAVRSTKITAKLFPLSFPPDDYIGLEPFQQLEKAEEQILAGFVPKDVIARLRFVQVESSSVPVDRTS
jgi:DnaJ homolog subfamily C member 17